MKTILGLVLSVLLSAGLFFYRHFGPEMLDGSAWEVKIRRRPFFPFAKKDTLLFDGGRLTSAKFASSGYFPGKYDSVKFGDDSQFEASTLHDDGSELHWKGRVTGDRMKGTLTLVRRNGRIRKYSFKGKRRGPRG